ncbi:CBO0543 family protein [Bacillus carboniphilus]|uniref:CBO0543 family protein n=1 Tax=Bacillus carboniphilus TaxID=86663 RepID=UPI003CD05ADD
MFGFLIILILLSILYWWTPKKINGIGIYSTIFFVLYFGLVWDAIFKGKYELYYYTENPDVHYTDFFVRITFYSITSLLFLNWFPFHHKFRTMILYFFAFILIIWSLEWVFVQILLIKYSGWKLIYSLPKYIFIYLGVWINHRMTNNFLKKEEWMSVKKT